MPYPTSPRYPSTKNDPTPLSDPLTFPFSKRTAPNRLMKAATSEHLATYSPPSSSSSSSYDDDNGIPKPELINLYSRFARGGWGQIVTGNIMITPSSLEGPGNAVIPPSSPFSGPRFAAFADLAEAGKSGGGIFVAQLSHPGRQGHGDDLISASAVQLSSETGMGTFAMPRAATKKDIRDVVEGFAFAAEYCERCGFDGVQLHAAHGYLLAQFLSGTTNKRTDEYGGEDVRNRARLVLEIAKAIKERVSPGFVLGVKVNSVEFQDGGGFTPDEAVALCRALEGAGFDYVETSGGTYECFAFEHRKESTVRRENYFIEFAEEIAKAVDRMKVYTTGGLRTVGGMLSTLEAVDGLGFGRVAVQEPDFAKDVLEGRVTGAIRCAIPEKDFPLQMAASSVVLQRIGHGEEPVDLSDPEVVKEVLAKVAELMGKSS
ncbi:NADH oxidase [Poronia punctata]|nr:NADH oxidase [Poronia punctata]